MIVDGTHGVMDLHKTIQDLYAEKEKLEVTEADGTEVLSLLMRAAG